MVRLAAITNMVQPCIWHLRNETTKPITPGPVGMDFAGGAKKQFALTQVHDSVAEFLFALSLDNKTDAGPIMNVLGEDKAGAMSAGEDSAIRDILDANDFSVMGRSKRV